MSQRFVDLISLHKSRAVQRARIWNRNLALFRGIDTSKVQDTAYFTDETMADIKDTPNGAIVDQPFVTNYIYAAIDTMVSNICPTNPQVTLKALLEQNAEAGAKREMVINKVLGRKDTRKAIRRMCFDTAINGTGFAKAVWRGDKRRVEFHNVDSRCLWFDETVDRWDDLDYIIEVTFHRKSQMDEWLKNGRSDGAATIKYKLKGEGQIAYFTDYAAWGKSQHITEYDVGINGDDPITAVYEVYDFRSRQYMHMVEGYVEPVYLLKSLPHIYLDNPYFTMTFIDNLTSMYGMSPITLIASLQEIIVEIDNIELNYARAGVPVPIIDQGGLSDADAFITAYSNIVDPRQAVVVSRGATGRPLSDIIEWSRPPVMSMDFARMRERAREGIEYVIGIPAYARGVIGQAEIATEVAQADMASRTRDGVRRTAVDEVVSEWGAAAIALYMEHMRDTDVVPVVLRETGDFAKVDRENMKMHSRVRFAKNNDKQKSKAIETIKQSIKEEWVYDCIPFSPAENNKLVRFSQLSRMIQLLMPFGQQVEWSKLVNEMARLLDINDIVKVNDMAPQGPPASDGTPGPEPIPGSVNQTENVQPGLLPTGGPGSMIDPGVAAALNGAG